ncbi:hypothetical protein BD410DRAFT_847154 [Rickenella mellea]|uniref:Uncharacterized protein n=1 Tax=Rickenella mellea TaxID=50990 RepID=A0A4Y7PDB5_9AGAM|nr:hypothetical protein BD410DRAFT_847154 [Rickenella mellea]
MLSPAFNTANFLSTALQPVSPTAADTISLFHRPAFPRYPLSTPLTPPAPSPMCPSIPADCTALSPPPMRRSPPPAVPCLSKAVVIHQLHRLQRHQLPASAPPRSMMTLSNSDMSPHRLHHCLHHGGYDIPLPPSYQPSQLRPNAGEKNCTHTYIFINLFVYFC